MDPLRAVFFDFGGTLFSYAAFEQAMRSEGDGRGVFARAAERLGVDADRRRIAKAWGRASGLAFQGFHDRSYYLHRDLFLETFRLFARELGAEADDAFLAWFYDLQRDALLSRFELRPDCRATLAALRAAGLSLHIVSNIDDDYLHPMVARSGLDALLDHWTSSEEARSCKPDRRFFELALEKAGCRASEVLFVGDSPVHDVAGAKAVGMRTALIREEGSPPPGQHGGAPESDHEIRALAELIPICLGERVR